MPSSMTASALLHADTGTAASAVSCAQAGVSDLAAALPQLAAHRHLLACLPAAVSGGEKL